MELKVDTTIARGGEVTEGGGMNLKTKTACKGQLKDQPEM